MIFSLLRKDPNAQRALSVYNAIVAQSRQDIFFLRCGINDDVTGRFDMIALHMIIVFHHLHKGDDSDRKFAQALFDLFFRDMDRSLREMGVGDISVPKKVKKMGEVFFGLLGAVKDSFEAGDTGTLTEALDRNLYDGEDGENAAIMAHYCLAQIEHFSQKRIDSGMTLDFLAAADVIDPTARGHAS